MAAIYGLIILFVGGWWLIGIGWTIAIVAIVCVLIILGLVSAAKNSDENKVADPQKNAHDAGFNVSARLKIRYMDAEGENTEREIHAHRYIDSSPGYVEGWCMKAKAGRTFRTDRIKEAVDMDSGEVIKRIPTFMRSKRTE